MITLRLAVLFLMVGLASCSPVLKESKIRLLTTNYCEPNVQYDYSKALDRDTVVNESLLLQYLSAHDLVLSKNIGIARFVAQYLMADEPAQRVYLKQKMTDAFLLSTVELQAIAAELDCNGERIEQLAKYVDDNNGKTATRLTVSSVIVGALTTVATVAIANNNMSTAVGVGGGLLSAGLGALTIKAKGNSVQMSFKRSLLRNVWSGSNADRSFPPSVWKILNEKTFSNTGNRTLIESTKNRWIHYAFDGEISKQEETLFFEAGGSFTADDLHTLANMYNELQASVRSVQQDLQSLILKVNSIEK